MSTPQTTKHFGLDWWVEANSHTIKYGNERPSVDWSEVSFVSVQELYNGGTFFINHNPDTGEWDIMLMGGSWDNPWDKELPGVYESPLAAMRAAAAIYREDEAEDRKWEAQIDEGIAAAAAAEAEWNARPLTEEEKVELLAAADRDFNNYMR